jgi:PAS domain S-box-containing protein
MKQKHPMKMQIIEQLQTLQSYLRGSKGMERERRQPVRSMLGQELLWGILSSLHQTVVVGFDYDGSYLCVFCPPDLEARYGIRSKDVVGKSLADIFPPEEAEKRMADLHHIFETGESLRETYLFHAQGGDFWHDITLSPMRGSSEEILMVIGFIRDITDRKGAEEELRQYHAQLEELVRQRTSELTNANKQLQREAIERNRAEEALRTSEEKYRLVVENANQGIVVIQDGKVRFVNPKVTEISGFSQEELSERSFPEFIHPDDRDLVANRHRDRLKGEEVPHVYAFRVRDRYGTIRWLEINAVLITWEGRPATLNFLSDITERKETLDALRESEERFRQLAENIDVVFWVNSLNGRKLYINPAYETVWKQPCERVYKEPAAWLESVHPEDRQHMIEVFEKSKQRDFVRSEYEYRIIWPSGEVRWISERAFPVVNEHGAVYRVAGIAEDITQHKHLEEQLIWSQKMETVGRLAGGVAHDFNNMLTIIRGYAELGRMGLHPADPLHGDLQEILGAANRAAKLTHQLLTFSRRQVIEPRVINLNDVLLHTDKMLRRIIGEDIELVTLPTEDLGRIRVDPGQVEQVLVNIAVNSRDAMPNGGKLTIETDNVTLDETYAARHVGVTPGEYVMLAVSDTGIGMTREVKEHLFEPFFTTKDAGKGIGLGLATCYGIVKQNGGNIWVYSEPGRGTTFKIYFPRVALEAEALPMRDESGYLPRGTETVLLVEDDPAVRTMAVRVLWEQGYTVLEAGNGEEALETAREHEGKTIHLLLTDVVIPQRGGKGLADCLRAERPDTKVLFMSGYPGEAVVHHGVLDSGTAFLHKPFSPSVLARKVREVLDG